MPSSAAPPQPLHEQTVHLWLVDARENVPPTWHEKYESLLSEDEQARWKKAKHPARREEYVLGRALLRTTLSRYANVTAKDWVFAENSHGAPRVDHPEAARALTFNLSHTQGLIACVVGYGRDVGVDVEWLGRSSRTVEVADRYFSPRELAALNKLPDAEQRGRFFDLWTLKEAYIMARGMGLAIPLKKFGFVFDAAGQPRLEVDPDLGDDPGAWRFYLSSPTPEHRAAVAVRGAAPVQLQTRWTRPLRD